MKQSLLLRLTIFALFAATLVILPPIATGAGKAVISASAAEEQVAHPSSSSPSCVALPIAKAEASGNEIGNVPSNVADGQPVTKWSFFGKGAWVSVDLGTLADICHVDVEWYRGNTRQSTFTISYSSDAATYTQLYSGKSSGNTSGFERYDFANVDARYVRITVNGNTQDDWSAIAEIKVYGDVSAVPDNTKPFIMVDQPANNSKVIASSSAASSDAATVSIRGKAEDFGSGVKIVEVRTDGTAYVPATPAASGDWSAWTHSLKLSSGAHNIVVRATDNAGNQQWHVSVVRVFQEPSSTVLAASPLKPKDRFGITQLYPSAAGGLEWSSKWDNGNARQFGNVVDPDDSWFETTHGIGNYTVDGNGTLTAAGNFTRMYVHDPANVREWSENLEITIYINRINETQLIDYSGLQIFARTNHGTNGNENRNFCDDRGYGVLVLTDGRWKLEKETAHHLSNGYVDLPGQKPWSELPKNTWVGIKFVLRNMDNDTKVKLELYRDMTGGLNGGRWEKMYEFIDNGTNFGAGYGACKPGVNPALPLVHSFIDPTSETRKPMLSVYARNEYGTMEYANFTIREINPLP
ncbi:F5/8 type C domain-containing protein [Candidatus Nitrososphaera evergladensis SR1]|uniref:F5/8 type C domain-containing protein n=1 Tax=Candidatus Nitrososphaera evergladensis SR1 TaxID=1459636 RepID=A0A075MUV5_9ARCH|nr:F5/8 type C domain-containing protein [Candidatus Nitrososphaera evergladensis SR1]